MSFEKKNITFTIFKLSEKLPEDVLELFNARKAGKLDDVTEEKQIGWTSGQNLLETRINETTSIIGGHILLNLRIAEKKIPAKFFGELCKREEFIWMQANCSERVPNKVKKEIREEVREKHGKNFPPVLSGTQFVIDRASNMVYLGAASGSKIDTFVALFTVTTGVEPIQVTSSELINDYYQEKNVNRDLDFTVDLPDIQFSKNADREDLNPARDFLTWLWFKSETDQFEDTEIMIEGSMKLSFMYEKQGATETVANKGIPQKSAEVKAALNMGKKLCKSKLSIVHMSNVWTCGFDSDKFSFNSMKLPDGEAMELHSVFEERIQNLHTFHTLLKYLFFKFIEFSISDDFDIKEKVLQQWTEERESF